MTDDDDTLTVGALFAGYGGLELGIEHALRDPHTRHALSTRLGRLIRRVRTSWVSEFADAPSRILAARFPDAPNLGDVTRIDWASTPRVDVLTGGSPCQDLSHAGRRAGMRPGTRSGLWASMCDAVDILRPELVLWENVRGAHSADAVSGVEPCPVCMGGADERVTLRALGRVLGDLAEVGYDSAWHGIHAADVGAPHERYRVFVLAWPAADTDGEPRHVWPRLRADRPGRVRRGRPDDDPVSDARRVALLPTPVVNDMGDGKSPEWWDEWVEGLRAQHGNGNGHGNSLAVEALRLLPTPTAADSKASGGAAGSSNVTLTDATVRRALRFGQYAEAVTVWERITGNPAPDPTEVGPKGGARLSPRFPEWMMGLPPGWVDVPGVSRTEQLKACGNGVVPQQAAAALSVLVRLAGAEVRP